MNWSGYMQGVGQGFDPLQSSAQGAPLYSPTSGALSASSMTVPTVDNSQASGAKPQQAQPIAGAPTDFGGLPEWYQTNTNNQANNRSSQDMQQAYATSLYGQQYQKYGQQLENPYFLSSEFKSDPRFAGVNVSNPFSTYETSMYGFQGDKYYAPGQGFDPISGSFQRGGGIYDLPRNSPTAVGGAASELARIGSMFGGRINGQSAASYGNSDPFSQVYSQVAEFTPGMNYDQFASMYNNQYTGGAYPSMQATGSLYGTDQRYGR